MQFLHISLFSGIGGFDLAAQKIGWENAASCEINSFGQKILTYYWPLAYHHKDIHDFNFETVNPILCGRFGHDWRTKYRLIISGGFPCQPYSNAGKRLGKNDDRHLWPEMLRIIREFQPDWIVGENVRGIISWNGGLVFDEVQSDLEVQGYQVVPFLLPACGINAPHKRDRIWFVAHTNSDGHNGARHLFSQNRSEENQSITVEEEWERFRDVFGRNVSERFIADSDCERLPKPSRRKQRSIYEKEKSPKRSKSNRTLTENERWAKFPTQSPVCSGNDGLPTGLDGITIQKWRIETTKGAGNAIVPELAYILFNAIQEYENYFLESLA